MSPSQVTRCLRRPPFPIHHALTLDNVEKSPPLTRIPGTAILIDSGIHVRKYLNKELSVSSLNDVHNYLWMSGRMNELHALHWQRMAKRDIVITENPGLHLLWYDSTIFVKPVSPFLLDHNFFLEHICPDDTLFRAACGFLRSYAHLIQHESDFRIAHSLGLLPTHVTWMQWSEFAYSLSNIPLSDVNERYQYGELQLNRINLIYNVFRARPWYYKIHRDYQSWLSYELGFMFVLLAYVSVVMSGFQVVLTTPLVSWDISVLCYWTSMAAIVLTVAVIAWHCLGFILCSFLSFMQALR